MRYNMPIEIGEEAMESLLDYLDKSTELNRVALDLYTTFIEASKAEPSENEVIVMPLEKMLERLRVAGLAEAKAKVKMNEEMKKSIGWW